MEILVALVAKLGISEVARRVGVTNRTIRHWLRHDPSYKGGRIVAEVAARHLRSLRGAETRRQKQQAETGIAPPEGAGLPAIDVLPTAPPKVPPQVSRHEEIDTEFSEGVRVWIEVQKPVDENFDDDRDVLRPAHTVWAGSNRRFCYVKFLFMRYIPRNPGYTRSHELFTKQGKWLDVWMTSKTAATPNDLDRYVGAVLDKARSWSYSRVIWLEKIGVSCIDRKLRPKAKIRQRKRR